MLEQKATIGKLEYQFHQVAMYYPTMEQFLKAEYMWKGLGHEFTMDRATLRGATGDPQTIEDQLDGVVHEWTDSVVTANMMFCYTIMPMEFELLHYSDGDHRHRYHKEPFISHFSVYTEDLEKEAAALTDVLGYGPYYRFTTEGHTNPRVKGKKRFKETIFDTREILGADLKFIQKVPWDYQG